MGNNSSDCIAENMIQVSDRPDLVRISEKGRQFVKENYIFEKTVEKWNPIFMEPIEL